MRYKYKVCKGQKVLALSTTLHEAKAEAKRVGGRVVPVGRKNPPDPEYATELGGGAFSKAYGRPPQAKDFHGTPIDAGPRGVEAITGRGGMYNFDSFDAGKTALILARKALIAKKNYAAAKYLPEITPVRLDKNSVGVREYVYAMPYYTQWEAAPYGSHPELAKFLRWALDKGLITGMVEMPEAIKRFMAKVDDELRFFPNKDDAAEYKAEANNVAKALYAIHEAVNKLGVDRRRDFYGSDMHGGNFALDGEQLILLDPVAVDLPEKVLDKVWYKNGWAKTPAVAAKAARAAKRRQGKLYTLLYKQKPWPAIEFSTSDREAQQRVEEFAALVHPLLQDAGYGTRSGIYQGLINKNVIYNEPTRAGINPIGFPESAEVLLEVIEQRWWNRRESEEARRSLEVLISNHRLKKQNPERTWIPPAEVAAEARQALALRAKQPESNKCCTPVGIARAKQLANRQPVSETTLRRMKAYFDRHAVDAKGKGWRVDSKGWQAWLAWGGDSGRAWCQKILRGL